MHRLALALVAATFAVAALASCHDAAGPGSASPIGTPAAVRYELGAGKVSVCHAAGRAGDAGYVEITVAEPGANEHLDPRGTPRAGHEQDFLVTDRTPCPPPETLGTLRVCKVGAPGIPAGTLFTFLIDGESVTLAAGGCLVRTAYRVGTRVNVSETVPPGMQLVGLTLTPADAGTVDLASASAGVVIGTDVATLTFTNQATTQGAVVVCKVAGTGITPGTMASFGLADGAEDPIGSSFTLAAGAGPTGTCTAPIAVPAGEVRVTETLAPNTAVGGTPVVSPIGANLGGGMTATTFTMGVQVTAGQTTTVTFTNVSTLGAVVICKVAGTGITPGTSASFTVTDAAGTALADPILVAAGEGPTGTCTAPITVPEGEVRVTETLAPNTAVGGTPVVSPIGANLGGGMTATTFTMRVQVTASQTTTVTFTNVAVP